jgi:hypothetical protein
MRNLSIAILLAFAAQCVEAQAPDTVLTNRFLLNFSVPDMPAFKALGTDPSNILRPSDIQKFASSFAPFYSGGQAVIPKNFALEFAPWKLGSKSWDLKKYNSGLNSLLYNSGFSIATIRDSSAFPSKIAVGYRLTITGKKGDILKAAYSQSLRWQLQSIQTRRFAALEAMKEYWIYQVQHVSTNITADSAAHYYSLNVSRFNSYIQSLWGTNVLGVSNAIVNNFFQAFNVHNTQDLARMTNAKTTIDDAIASSVDSILARFKESMWNANRFDLAVAWVGESKDTLIKNSQFSSFNLWMTYAVAIGQGSQLLFGTNLVLPRTEKNDSISNNFAITANIRYYLGTSSVRGFIESQYKYQNYSSLQRSLLFNLGGEFRLGQQFWVVANAGVNNYLGLKSPVSALVSSLNLRYGFNKSK